MPSKVANKSPLLRLTGHRRAWIKEEKYVLNWTRFPCHRFEANQVRLPIAGKGIIYFDC